MEEKQIDSLAIQQQLRDIQLKMEGLRARLDELEPVKQWYSDIRVTGKTLSLIMKGLGFLFGFILSVFAIVQLFQSVG